MDPLEYLRLARDRERQVLAMRRVGRLPVRLDFRADRLDGTGQQLVARHLEQAQRRFVGLDEAPGVGVDDRDGFGRVVHQRAVTRLAVAQRFLGGVPLGDVAQADARILRCGRGARG